VTTGQPADGELVDVIDQHGAVVGVATRAQMRAGNLRHRTVIVAVRTGDDRYVAHRRAAWKDVWPSRWDVCFGGVVGAGEAWEQAAVRELAEEAGVVVPVEDLRFVSEGTFEHPEVKERCRLYLVRSDGPFSFDDGEVEAFELVPRSELRAWCDRHELVPDSEAIVVPLLVELD
jgi:isopentenyldiphosphate isomerase